MFHKIRITVISLVVIAFCLLNSTATLSYFTDTETITNDFTVGNVSTNLVIYNDAAGNNEFNANQYVLSNSENIPFYVRATNDGNVPVYQRTRVVIPINLSGVMTLNLPTDDSCVIDVTSDTTCKNADYTVIYKKSVEVDNSTFAEYQIIGNNVLNPGATTVDWPITGIHIDSIDKSVLFECEDANNCKVKVNVSSDAVQTTGFDNALKAFGVVTE